MVVPSLRADFCRHWAFLMAFPRASALIFLSPSRTERVRRLGRFFFGFSIFWIICAFGLTYAAYIGARRALLSGNYSVVEGTVTDFVPAQGPPKGNPEERFTIAGQTFKYSDYDPAPGFGNTRAHLIRNGIYVRVTHKDNAILRLEIAH